MTELGADEDHHFAVTYQLTRADVAAYVDLPGTFSTRTKLALFLPPFVLGAAGEWLASVFNIDTASWSAMKRYAVIGVAIAAWFVLSTLGLSLQRLRRIRRFPLPPGEVQLRIGRSGVAIDEGLGMQRYQWRDIPWVHRGSAHIFMRATGERPIIVPLRAFEDADGMGRFAEFASASSNAALP